MQDITEQLALAKMLIRNMIAAHQGTPESSARYAMEQVSLPKDVERDLVEWAIQLDNNIHNHN